MEFELLADSIKQINDKASSAAKSAVNQLMTLRNWAIGYYIVEYEQDGSDRAEYGSHLLKNLEKQINQKGMNYTLFKACRQFYKVYPQIGSTVSSEFKLPDFGKSSTVSNEFVTDPDVLVNNLTEGNNPPVGILLCTDKGSQMVEYALAGIDNQLFVSTYMLHLPDKKKLEEFMLKEIEEMGM